MSVKRLPARDDTRERILAAARRLFARHGIDGVTISDVAEQARVSRTTVFNQFGAKQALVEALTEEVFRGYQETLERALRDKESSTLELVEELFHAMGRGIENDSTYYRRVFREVAGTFVGVNEGGVAERARTAARETLTHLLTRGQARGEISKARRPEDLAVAFDSLVFGTISHWLYGDGEESLVDPMLRTAAFFVDAVRTSTDEAPDAAVPNLPARRRSQPQTARRPRKS